MFKGVFGNRPYNTVHLLFIQSYVVTQKHDRPDAWGRSVDDATFVPRVYFGSSTTRPFGLSHST